MPTHVEPPRQQSPGLRPQVRVPRGLKTPLERAFIVAVYNQKGGCGKSMTAMQVGGTLGLLGFRVLILDMDQQLTATRWCSQADYEGSLGAFPAVVMQMTGYESGFGRELRKLISSYDFILIDCPPVVESRVPKAALLAADIGIIPIIPVGDNVWASAKAFDLGQEIQADNPELTLHVLPSRMEKTILAAKFLEQIEQLVQERGIGLIPAKVYRRNAYLVSQVMGATVHALGKDKAVEEINAVAQWLLDTVAKRRA